MSNDLDALRRIDHKQRAVLKSAYSFASTSEPILHFGLGTREKVDRIEIRWPDGSGSLSGILLAGVEVQDLNASRFLFS